MRSPVVLFVLLLLVSSASAQSSGGWLRDELTGCHAWNSNPEIGKTFNWSGNCSNNVAAGPGVMRWYVNGSPSGRYVGEYDDGRMSGRGIFEYRNGDRYDGEFSDDEPNGYGTLARANGTRYSGLYRDGHPVRDEAAPVDSKGYVAEPRDRAEERASIPSGEPVYPPPPQWLLYPMRRLMTYKGEAREVC